MAGDCLHILNDLGERSVSLRDQLLCPPRIPAWDQVPQALGMPAWLSSLTGTWPQDLWGTPP